MKTHKILLILFAAFTGWCGTMNAQDADLKKRMKDADPKVIGTRIDQQVPDHPSYPLWKSAGGKGSQLCDLS